MRFPAGTAPGQAKKIVMVSCVWRGSTLSSGKTCPTVRQNDSPYGIRSSRIFDLPEGAT
jgi:hypothetical protein